MKIELTAEIGRLRAEVKALQQSLLQRVKENEVLQLSIERDAVQVFNAKNLLGDAKAVEAKANEKLCSAQATTGIAPPKYGFSLPIDTFEYL